MTVPKCQKCGQWRAQVKLTCRNCGVVLMYCTSCKQKKDNHCSACGSTQGWDASDIGGGSIIVDSGPSTAEVYEKRKDQVLAQREKDGPNMHWGVELDEDGSKDR